MRYLLTNFRSVFESSKAVFLIALILMIIPNFAISESFPEPLGILKNYALVTTEKNYPIAKTKTIFESGGYSFGIQYFHSLNTDWVMAVGGHFKNFNDRKNGGLRSIMTGSHETLKMVRIYYPTYLLFGFQSLYLLPSLNNSFPPKRDTSLSAEVGVGLSAYMVSKIAKDYLVYLRAGRWRGTKTTQLQAFNLSFGLGVGL